MTSQRQRKAGFELPDPVLGWPLIDVCLKIPDAPQYRRAFLGHIYKLGLWAAWEKSYLPGDTRAKDAGELWRETLNQYLMMGDDCMGGCCNDPPPIYRYNDAGDLEQSTDGGETWTPAPGFDARYNSPQFPPVAGADGDDKKCIAATGAALLMKEQVADQLTDDMARYTLSNLLKNWTQTVMDSGGNIFQALLTIAANQTFSLGIAALRAALTDDVWDTMKCILYCHMSDDASFTDAQWRLVLADIVDQIGGIADVFLDQLVTVLGPVGLTNLARSGGATSGDCVCGCGSCDIDNWNIVIYDGLPVGTIVSRGADYIILTGTGHPDFGTPFNAMIETNSDDSCCIPLIIDYLSGDPDTTPYFGRNCGGPRWPGGPNGPIEIGVTSCNTIFIRGDVGNFVVKITLGQ